ncbi:NADH-quinone oxidoreductase subunit E [Alistipes sp. An54]|uniref:proton-conducting transporter transmembrane domain-containing protein n=1 Tax=Alistipes sp. An54 TaxID=1965645 RepID=UPI000B3855A7|nr:proton-conducting transporter membrane subunit [Alistipes sp. An54]OUN76925.1 NADH-quinone oxidoreductase subunit E [Alistipes sp. An54]
MLFIYTLLFLVVVVAAIFSTPLRAKAWTALALTAAGALWASVRAIGVLADGGTESLWMIPGTLFGGDSGSMDPLSALFVLLISIGSVASVLYSRGYLAHTLREKSPAHVSLHYTSLTVMAYAMLGVVCSDGGYSFLFFWELMTVASFLLILYDAQRREVSRAALAYLIMMHVGFVLLVVGFVRLDAVCGRATFDALGQYFHTKPALPLFLVFLAGFGMKAGLFPLHVWLPEAHPAAPSHVSALMSGVMIKTGIYGILRTTAALGDLPVLHTAGVILLVVGIVTGLWGVILAAMQNDVKRLLAYSSIENIGIILLAAGIAALGKASGNQMVALCGIAGALLHALNHSFFKSLLFFGAGNILSQTHTTSLDALGGLTKHMPLTSLLFLAATAAICALPPLNGFVSELLVYLGLLDGIASGSNVLASAAGLAALALIGGVAVLAFTKLYGTVFLGSPRSHEVAEASEVDNLRLAAMALPLAGILLVGLFPRAAVGCVTRAAEFFLRTPSDAADWLLSPTLTAVGRIAWGLILVVAILAWLRRRTLRGRQVTEGPTWGCGFTAVNTRMQYTGESFSEGLQSIATSLTQNSGEGSPVGKGEIFPDAHRFDVGHRDRIGRLFSAWWVELLRLINQRVMRLRTGKINHYVLFALAFLALVFLLSILHII